MELARRVIRLVVGLSAGWLGLSAPEAQATQGYLVAVIAGVMAVIEMWRMFTAKRAATAK